MDGVKSHYKFPWQLFVALMLLTFVPSVYQTFRVYFLVTSGSIDSLDIIGQIEWFDLINETLKAFLIIPLYYILSNFLGDKKIFSSRITQAGIITFIIYLLFSVIVYFSALDWVNFMVTSGQSLTEITTYLQLETIGFAIGIIGSFFGVVFILIGKSRYIYTLLIANMIFTVIGDSILIPEFGVNGAAYTNIILNLMIAGVSLGLLHHEGLLYLKLDKIGDYTWIKQWIKVGLFSGATILLDNIIYTVIISKMVNDVAEVGNYWVANNFIWGWLLIPTLALAEIIRKECTHGCKRENMIAYLTVNVIILAAWIVSIPAWSFVFKDFMAISDPSAIIAILILLVPFYVFYNLCSLFDNIFYGMGKTLYVFITSLVVNIGYYGIMYMLFLQGVFTESMEFIIFMFGCGMIIHFITIFLLYIYSGKKYGINWIGGNREKNTT